MMSVFLLRATASTARYYWGAY